MKKIERYTPKYPLNNQAIFIFVKIDRLDHLERTVEELVGRLIDNVKGWEALADSYGCGFVDEDINYLETITGKTWEELKGEIG